MMITKCDLCKKTIKKREDIVHAGISGWNVKELCKKCGMPVIKFLIKNKLAKKDSI